MFETSKVYNKLQTGEKEKMKKNIFKLSICILSGMICLFSILSCGTMPTEETVAKDLTPIELKQLAQEEMDKGHTKYALAYYEILLKRYGSDMSIRSAAEFEIAHIYIKQKKMYKADELLEDIIKRYESAGGAGLVPKYYVLAKKDYKITQEYISKKGKKVEKKKDKEPEESQGSDEAEAVNE